METRSEPRIVVVTGASRGLGKGVAMALGAAGDIVYVSGRSSDKATGTWPGTIHETAAQIDQAGGRGIAVACDHHDDAQTAALFARVRREQGRLDILVNNAFGMPDAAGAPGVFWERPLELWDQIITIGLRSSYVASYHAIPLMLARRKGLIVNTSGRGARAYVHPLPYGIGKAGQDKFAFDMAHDLRPYGIAAISLWPGLIRTERTLSGLRKSPEHFADRGGEERAESPQFMGRIIDALYRDAGMMRHTGGTFYTAEIAQQYGVRDIDGKEPGLFRHVFGPPSFEPMASGLLPDYSGAPLATRDLGD